MNTFQIHAIAPSYLDGVRAQGHDEFGNPLAARTVVPGGEEPLRCCLRESRAGEQMVLIAYQPSASGGPYAEVGPVFVHAERCPGWSGDGYPEGFRHRRQLLRAYDEGGNAVDNVVVEAGEQETGIEKLLGRPEVALVHSRNLLAGCFMFTIHPALP